MTGVEVILLLIGSVFMVGSFFITEKLSPSELNKIAELSESELKKIINRALEGAGQRIDTAIEEHIEISAEQVDRALEKETNEKIMAISEYSDTVVESMNKTHNEIMFLYSMLNDKHTELTGMVSNLQHIASDVRSLEEGLQQITEEASAVLAAASDMPEPVESRATPQMAAHDVKAAPEERLSAQSAKVVERRKEAPKKSAVPPQADAKAGTNEQILALHREGLSEVEIARRLGIGVGEVRLIIGLYRGEVDS